MEFETLNKKKIVDGKIDLLSNFFKIDYDKVIVQDWIMIDDTTTISLDLICHVAYGNSEFLDLVLKFNRLSSGLDLGIGQIIAIPDINSLIANSKYVDLTKEKQSVVTIKSSQQISALTNPSTKSIPATNFVKLKGNYVF